MPKIITSNIQKCKACLKDFERTSENFYMRGEKIRECVCKGCNSKREAERVQSKRNRLKNMGNLNSEANRERLMIKANTRYFPKGHPMNPIRCATVAE
jgi:hypothetical protein